VRRDVTFEEEVSFSKYRGSHMEIDSEIQGDIFPSPPHPRAVQRETVEPIDPINLVDHVSPVNVPKDTAVGQKRPAWAHQTLQEAKGHVAPHSTFRESKTPQRYSCYFAYMSHNH
jgi:hypothetical protein